MTHTFTQFHNIFNSCMHDTRFVFTLSCFHPTKDCVILCLNFFFWEVAIRFFINTIAHKLPLYVLRNCPYFMMKLLLDVITFLLNSLFHLQSIIVFHLIISSSFNSNDNKGGKSLSLYLSFELLYEIYVE